MLRLCPAVLVLVLAPLASAFGALAVNSTLDLPDADLQDGVCDADLDTPGEQVTLRAAVQHANVTVGADVISVPAGLYKLKLKGSDEDAAATGDLDLTEDVTIEGEDKATTIIDAKKLKDRIFEIFPDVSVVASGLTLRGGKAKGEQLGGGAFRVDGTLDLSQSILTKCKSADDGGAIEFSPLHVGESQLVDVLIEKCKAGDDGGAIDSDSGDLDIRRCTFAKNHSGDQGGAMELSGGLMLVVNCTFSSNGGKHEGGALSAEEGAEVTLVQCTLTKCKSKKGAAINILDPGEGTSVIVANTLIACSPKKNCNDGSLLTSAGGNLETGTSCGFTGDSDQSSVKTKLLLLPLADNGGSTPTHLPKPGSPAIDTGDDLVAMKAAEDQRELPRPVDIDGIGTTTADVGAVELQTDEVE